MIELIKTTDPVRLTFLQALLHDAGIDCFVMGAPTPWPGAFPSQLMVREPDVARARGVLKEAGEA